MVRVPEIDSGSGVPVGSEFSDDFATGLDTAWVGAPAFVGGLNSDLWACNSGGYLEHDGGGVASSAFPRANPDGDFWWVYARPGTATGDDVLTAHLRIVGHNTDTQLDAEFLMLDIDTDELSLQRNGTNGELASAAITTANDTPYLIHAHVSGANVIIRRGRLGQPLETILSTDNAPIQAADRFILSTSSHCIVDDVNVGHFNMEEAYVYDALGRRIEERAGGDATRFVYDGAQVAEEWSVSDGADMHNVVKLTDSDGEVVEAYDYGDYGQPEYYDAAGDPLDVTESAFGNPYLFSGREWDPELGVYYFRNRYMDPGLGRFVSRDLLGIWGDPLNLGNGYTYTASNPWSLVDPFGLESGGNIFQWIKDALNSWISPENTNEIAAKNKAEHETIEGNFDYNGLETPKGITAEQLFSASTTQAQVEGTEGAIEAGKFALNEGALQAVGGGIGKLGKLGKVVDDLDANKIKVARIACFPAGTLVLMVDGSERAIEEIREGGMVLADDPEDASGNDGFRVAKIFKYYPTRLIELLVDSNSDGRADAKFRATGEHPIWTPNRGVHGPQKPCGNG